MQAEILVKAQQDIGDTMGELGLTFVKLAKYETENATYLSQRTRAAEIKQFATAALRISRFYRESNAQAVRHLVPSIIKHDFIFLYICLTILVQIPYLKWILFLFTFMNT